MAGNQRKPGTATIAARTTLLPKQLPRAPKGMGPPGRKAWRDIGRELCSRGTLTRGDLPALEILCRQFDVVSQAEANVAVRGLLVYNDKGEPKRNPATNIRAEAERIMLRMFKEFGLTPASAGAAPTNPVNSEVESDEAKARALIDNLGKSTATGQVAN
jgi:P27 family predicted phage terminase small subunit